MGVTASDEIGDITQALRTQTVECLDYLLLEGSPSGYVQFPRPSEKRLPQGELPVELFSEAVSNEYLEAPYKLSAEQESTLRKLGWNDPGDVSYATISATSPNWWRVFPLGSDDRFNEIAAAAHATLVEAYGHQGALAITMAD